MAIKLIANYCKRLGLPNYSSHQFSVSVEAELGAADDVAAESQRLYQLLQTSVDEQIQTTGFVPGTTYGMDGEPPSSAVSHDNDPSTTPFNGANWACSEKQRELLLKLVEEHHLDKNEVEVLARQRFGAGVLRLNRARMSGLLDFLLEQHGGSSRRPPAGQSRSQRNSSSPTTRRAA